MENETFLKDILKIRISKEEKQRFKEYCKENETTMSETLRNFINSLE